MQGVYGALVWAIAKVWLEDVCKLTLINVFAENRQDEAYRLFISSLKRNPAYAPAFTSLGIYYAGFASPRDPTRASKCFQKAFELDAREGEAARRLAEGFAEEYEWDLVEVVARRTIEGEGGMDAGLQITEGSAVGRYLFTNAWAWKAVGVVELVSIFVRVSSRRYIN